jgi:hypothetical protein
LDSLPELLNASQIKQEGRRKAALLGTKDPYLTNLKQDNQQDDDGSQWDQQDNTDDHQDKDDGAKDQSDDAEHQANHRPNNS